MEAGKKESQELLDSVLSFAEELLLKQGEFFPYGGAMKSSGELVSIAAYDGDEQPPSTQVIEQLNRAFRAAAAKKEYKATALVYDVRIRLEDGAVSDAIAVNLDHQSGYSVVVYLPYSVQNDAVEFGQTTAQPGKNSIFN